MQAGARQVGAQGARGDSAAHTRNQALRAAGRGRPPEQAAHHGGAREEARGGEEDAAGFAAEAGQPPAREEVDQEEDKEVEEEEEEGENHFFWESVEKRATNSMNVFLAVPVCLISIESCKRGPVRKNNNLFCRGYILLLLVRSCNSPA